MFTSMYCQKFLLLSFTYDYLDQASANYGLSPVLYDLWAKNGFYLFKGSLKKKKKEYMMRPYMANKA